jgi:sodium/hydrogen exchanger 8
MAFAFIGTTISAVFIGSVLYGFGQADVIEPMSFVKNMMMGSLISAVDPVAVILVLKTLHVDEQLKVLLFGESVLNDAASVVINRVFVSVADNEKSELEALAPALPLILGVAIASMLIGTVLGLFIAYIFKKLDLHKIPEIELAAFFIGAFLPYTIAEALAMSGIMSVLFAGIMFDYYTYHHLSPNTQTTTRQTVASMSYLAETFVFIYLGMSFFLEEGHYFSGGYVAMTVLLCLVGRALSVFPLAFLLNFGRKHRLPFKHQIILWFSGLRGPVAYALAVATPADEVHPSDNNLIITTTIFVVAATTFILGGLSYPFLHWLRPPLMRSTSVTKTSTYDISNHWFSRLDRRFLSPYFGPDTRRKKRALAPEPVLH